MEFLLGVLLLYCIEYKKQLCRQGSYPPFITVHFKRFSVCGSISNTLLTPWGFVLFCTHVDMSPSNLAMPECPWCILDVVTLIFTAVCLESDYCMCAECEKRAKESQAVLSSDNIISLTVSLCIEIFSTFHGQMGGILIFVPGFTTVAGTTAHRGTCQGVIMIRVISFRGPAAKVMLTSSYITGGMRIAFYWSLSQPFPNNFIFFKWDMQHGFIFDPVLYLNKNCKS